MEKIYDIAIVGLGACGMTASLYCARGGFSVIGIERELEGGQLRLIECLENFPSYKGSGSDLAEMMVDQLADYPNYTVLYDEVTRVKKAICEDCYEIHTEFDDIIKARGVIIANGTKPRRIPMLEGFSNVHYCAMCDGSLYHGKNLVVIGGGNSAYSEAIYLKGLGNEVTILYRGDRPRAEKCLMDKAFNMGIRTVLGFQLNGTTGELKVDSLLSVEQIVPCDGVFIAIGRETDNSFYGELSIDDRVVIANDGNQVVTACGKGAEAGMKMMEMLR